MAQIIEALSNRTSATTANSKSFPPRHLSSDHDGRGGSSTTTYTSAISTITTIGAACARYYWDLLPAAVAGCRRVAVGPFVRLSMKLLDWALWRAGARTRCAPAVAGRVAFAQPPATTTDRHRRDETARMIGQREKVVGYRDLLAALLAGGRVLLEPRRSRVSPRRWPRDRSPRRRVSASPGSSSRPTCCRATSRARP